MLQFLKNILKFSSVILVPALLLGLLYALLDPFKVIGSCDNFYPDNEKARVGLNRDYVSTATLIHNSKDIQYDSFIFGNSRSLFYQIDDWKSFLDTDAKCFHFDASGESLWAIHKKVQYLDKKGYDIRNALLVLDYATLMQDTQKEGHLSVISPQLVGYSNLIQFHTTFLLAFLDPKFLFAYSDYLMSGTVKSYMKKSYLLSDTPLSYNLMNNEMRFDYFEEMILEDRYFTPERMASFYIRDNSSQPCYERAIMKNQKQMLIDIANICKRHNTKMKVVISPLYDQYKLDTNDLAFLISIFGSDNVHDFSGVNDITNDYLNYYENSHYRPHVARYILNTIYSSPE